MSKVYDFCSHIRWTGNLSQGNATYKSYVVTGTDLLAADAVHGKIHEVCFIARSVNFPEACDARYLQG
jgi:organic hydroperoxide reductase OsmC/OhrA